MHAVDVLAASMDRNCPDFPSIPADIDHGVCCLTGETGPTTNRANVVKPSFTRNDLLRAPSSRRASVNAYLALNYKWARMSSWICDGHTFTRLDRVGVRNAVFGDLPTTPWIGYATTSYKKHGVLLTPVNSGMRRVWVFENEVVDLTDTDRRNEWWRILGAALRSGIGRSVIESLDCPAFLIRQVGLQTWVEFESWARPKYRTALYRLLCYLLPSQDELRSGLL